MSVESPCTEACRGDRTRNRDRQPWYPIQGTSGRDSYPHRGVPERVFRSRSGGLAGRVGESPKVSACPGRGSGDHGNTDDSPSGRGSAKTLCRQRCERRRWRASGHLLQLPAFRQTECWAESSVRSAQCAAMRYRSLVADGSRGLAGTSRPHSYAPGIDPTWVHGSARGMCWPGTFKNAPRYPCYTRAVAWLPDNESRGRSGSQRQTEATSWRCLTPPLVALAERRVEYCHGMEGFQPLRHAPRYLTPTCPRSWAEWSFVEGGCYAPKLPCADVEALQWERSHRITVRLPCSWSRS